MLGFAIHEKPTIGLLRLESLLDQLLEEAVALNDVPGGMTFTHGTSGWDPYNRVIDAPAARRRRAFMPGRRRVFEFDLIEGAGTNLFPFGWAEDFALWSPGNAGTTSAQGATDPNGGSTAWTITNANTGGDNRAQVNFTIANDSVTRTFSVFVAKTKGTPTYFPAISLSLSGGTGVSSFCVFNPTTGAFVQTGSVTAQVVSAGNFWRVSVGVTNNTSGNTTASTKIYPAYSTTLSTTESNVPGSNVFCYGQFEALAFPTSYISTRNTMTFSQALSNAAWTKTNATVVDNNTTDPNGNTTASTLTLSTTGGIITRTVTVTASTNYVFSFYYKAGTATTPTYLVYDATHSANISTATYTPTSAWQRQTIAFTTPSGCTSIKIYQVDGATGAGTILLWGAQLEYGTAATAYWGVDATVGGRDADNLTSTYAIGTGAGTTLGFLIPYGWTTNAGGVNAQLLDDGTTTGVMSLLCTGSTNNVDRSDSGGVKGAVAGGSIVPTSNVLMQLAEVYGASNLTAYANGIAGTPTTTVTPYVSSTTQVIGALQTQASQFAYAWVAVLYFPRALSAQELLTLASICTGKVAA